MDNSEMCSEYEAPLNQHLTKLPTRAYWLGKNPIPDFPEP